MVVLFAIFHVLNRFFFLKFQLQNAYVVPHFLTVLTLIASLLKTKKLLNSFYVKLTGILVTAYSISTLLCMFSIHPLARVVSSNMIN